MGAKDHINEKFGRNTLFPVYGCTKPGKWGMRQKYLSYDCTSDIQHLREVETDDGILLCVM